LLTTNSRARAQRGRAMIEPVLGDLVHQPMVETQSPDQLMQGGAPQGNTKAEPALPPETMERAVHELLDRRYREPLDEPVPMLDNLSPREAARRPDTRAMVADWLKYLENANARQPADSPMASYDTGWMWTELGLSDLRR